VFLYAASAQVGFAGVVGSVFVPFFGSGILLLHFGFNVKLRDFDQASQRSDVVSVGGLDDHHAGLITCTCDQGGFGKVHFEFGSISGGIPGIFDEDAQRWEVEPLALQALLIGRIEALDWSRLFVGERLFQSSGHVLALGMLQGRDDCLEVCTTRKGLKALVARKRVRPAAPVVFEDSAKFFIAGEIMRRRHDRAGRIDGWGNDVHMPVEKGRAPRFRFRMTPDDGAGSIEAEFGAQPIDGLQHLFVGREPRGGNNPVDSRNFTTELPRIGPCVEDVGEVPSQGHDLFVVVGVLDVRD
jgi:hypothetical protein